MLENFSPNVNEKSIMEEMIDIVVAELQVFIRGPELIHVVQLHKYKSFDASLKEMTLTLGT